MPTLQILCQFFGIPFAVPIWRKPLQDKDLQQFAGPFLRKSLQDNDLRQLSSANIVPIAFEK